MGERKLDGLGDTLRNPGEDEPDQPDETETSGAKSDSGEVDSASDSGGTSGEEADAESGFTEESTPAQCQETTRAGTQCDHDAQDGSRYCKKHQPDKFGNQPKDFERKQWSLLPEVMAGLFDDSVTADSLYIDVQKELGESFQKKSVENKMGEFLIEHREEFIDFIDEEYANSQ